MSAQLITFFYINRERNFYERGYSVVKAHVPNFVPLKNIAVQPFR